MLFVDGHQSHISLQDCKREGNTFILSSSSYDTHTPAIKRWCLCSYQASLEKNYERLQTETLAANVTKEAFPGSS